MNIYTLFIFKGDEELNAFKYNEEKTLMWLQKKTGRVADILKQKNIHVSGGAVSATFVKSSREEPTDNESYLKYAHGIVSEYLMDDLSQKLLKYLNLPEDSSASLKRKSNNAVLHESKKIKLDEQKPNSSTNVLDLSKPEIKTVKEPIQSSKDKLRAKAATGSKSISSFFKKT